VQTPATPAQADGWRNRYHLTVPDSWMNDPQRPIRIGDAYHLYYLYNPDYPHGGGTAWRHASTSDGLHFTDHGVAIAKNTEPNGDLWSGSLVVDHENTAGFGAEAVLALITQPDHVGGTGAQAQFLWYSTDQGQTFTNLGNEPVIANPGREDFRDPKVIWDAERRQWVCALAEGHDLGLYTSSDLHSWRAAGRFHEDRFGILECPDIFQMRADDGTVHWVLAASVNQVGETHPGTYGYWTGDFDGNHFTPDSPDPGWLDYGFDWYAAVTWPAVDEDTGEGLDRRWALGWLNNWAYADEAPTFGDEGFNGVDSVVRELRLRHDGSGRYRLCSQPVPALTSHGYAFESIDRTFQGTELLDLQSRSFHAQLAVPDPGEAPVGIRARLSQDQSQYIEIGVSRGAVYVDRHLGGDPSGGRFGRSELRIDEGPSTLEVFVDHTTVEVFVNGADVLSNLAFSAPEDLGIATFGPEAGDIRADLRIGLIG
jgi:sucrose-6-phosphate hydrolase SacC (GH32 family)